MKLSTLLRWYGAAFAVMAAVIFFGYLHRNDRTVICKETVVGAQVYANGCIRK